MTLTHPESNLQQRQWYMYTRSLMLNEIFGG